MCTPILCKLYGANVYVMVIPNIQLTPLNRWMQYLTAHLEKTYDRLLVLSFNKQVEQAYRRAATDRRSSKLGVSKIEMAVSRSFFYHQFGLYILFILLIARVISVKTLNFCLEASKFRMHPLKAYTITTCYRAR